MYLLETSRYHSIAKDDAGMLTRRGLTSEQINISKHQQPVLLLALTSSTKVGVVLWCNTAALADDVNTGPPGRPRINWK